MTQRPRVFWSELTGRAYAVTRYHETPEGATVAEVKHDVTADVVHHLMALAWLRGWDDCDTARVGPVNGDPRSLRRSSNTPSLGKRPGHRAGALCR